MSDPSEGLASHSFNYMQQKLGNRLYMFEDSRQYSLGVDSNDDEFHSLGISSLEVSVEDVSPWYHAGI